MLLMRAVENTSQSMLISPPQLLVRSDQATDRDHFQKSLSLQTRHPEDVKRGPGRV